MHQEVELLDTKDKKLGKRFLIKVSKSTFEEVRVSFLFLEDLSVCLSKGRTYHKKLISIPCVKIPGESHFSRCSLVQRHREK